MSIFQYRLHDFIVSVPSCLETATLDAVLELFALGKCDSVVVVNQKQVPIGLLSSQHLMRELMPAMGQEKSSMVDLRQSILEWGKIEAVETISASMSLSEFSSLLGSEKTLPKVHKNWVVTDSKGKFLGMLDNSSILNLLLSLKPNSQKQSKQTKNSKAAKAKSKFQSISSNECQPLIQLLERLPWPLMLQTASGEILTQNPAWWKQLGALKDPESVRQQVEEILATSLTTEPAYELATVVGKLSNNQDKAINPLVNYSKVDKSLASSKNVEDITSKTTTPNRCFLDSQGGSCTCVVEVNNGQERIWQFAKIPLSNSDLQMNNKLNHQESEISHQNEEFAIKPDLWLVLATDVTEQQQLFKELAAKNADLIQLNRLKDEFLACISHELKTPLTAVLGLSRLLIDKQLGELNERQARYAGLIHQSGRHLMSVVNDILDLTRMETGQMELTPSHVKIRPVCERAIKEAQAIHAEGKKAKLSHNVSSENSNSEHKFSLVIESGLEDIIADELRLRQMLVHLLDNAFKFTNASGEIGLKVSRWEGWIAFTVWDTGIGIPEHQQHLIFQKFQQLENPLTRQFEGTGLGLVLTRALARLHGGDVSFLSSEGKGSNFTLLLPPCPPQEIKTKAVGGQGSNIAKDTRKKSHTLPSKPREPKETSPFPDPGGSSSQRLILVVEAVARYIQDLTEHLTGLGYRVVIARSGCEAVEKARRLQPKAIFLNPLLPLLSGWDVLTLLKSDTATRHIPVIVTATRAEKQKAFANRADGFVAVPVQHHVLAALLESVCATPETKQPSQQEKSESPPRNQLRILRLVNSQLETFHAHQLLREHRVVEVDSLEQAELLARVWQFDVVLLDPEVKVNSSYLKKLQASSRLSSLPLVTCDVATTQLASQLPGLSVFPCLTPLGAEKTNIVDKETLLSVLQIASGMCCPASILVVDLTKLPDLPGVGRENLQNFIAEKSYYVSSITESKNGSNSKKSKLQSNPRGSEWFQALLQYLQTAGFRAAMARTWAELLQQIRHRSVDMLLICLGESKQEKYVLEALNSLGKLPFHLPPVLVIDQQINFLSPKNQTHESDSLKTVVGDYATEILPRSISMEDLLNQINQVIGS